ncbi:MAG: HAMP domain-containing histidine kinase [Clostridia bacterium]|nr:HAMP domain-containing histidine kinase [Clostridia bacterium]
MKKYVFNLPVKILAFLLCVVCLFSSVISGFGIFALICQDGYRYSWDKVCKKSLEAEYGWLCDSVAYMYNETHYDGEGVFESSLSELKDEVNFYCTVSSLRMVLYSDDYDPASDDHIAHFEERIYILPDSPYDVEKVYDVELYLAEPIEGSNLETKLELLKAFYDLRYALIAICSSCAVGTILLLIFLLISAGRKGANLPKLCFFDKVPLEIYLFGGVVAFFIEESFFDIAPAQDWFCLLAAALFLLADSILLILFLISVAKRIKTKSFIKTTFVGKIWFFTRKNLYRLSRFWENMKLVPKLVFVLICLALFDLILATMVVYSVFLTVLLIEGLCLSVVLVWYGASLQHLKDDQEIISEGKLDHRCEIERLPWGIRPLADAMNRSAEGMEKAVEEKIKSERFKTELITNVSHDIKTPLTSIINYVDLIKKEKTKNERIKEYVEILDRQSTRLKKLTEDLVESSKAASGILPVEMDCCDVGVLLEQALGEYQSAFEEKGLIPCFLLPEETVSVLADGKLLWRVMDNLLRNIEKYALSGTRVYVNLEEKEGKAQITFRNISAQPISMSGEYLSERFVRGDLSRNTEGSGLGLAIAKSLVELQKGSFSITVDGDLFKAVIEFDIYKER